MANLETFMDIAIEEAKISLKEGNNGFGAVIIKGNNLISQAHDSDNTSYDPTAQLSDIKKDDCAILYNEQERKSIKQLRDIASIQLSKLSEVHTIIRLKWFSKRSFQIASDNYLDSAYRLFLNKLGINSDDAPIVKREKNKLVIHSINFCPTLEACKILDLDTRVVCKKLSEGPTQELLKQVNPKLRFKRNYDKIRPFAPYCEEMILLEDS